MNISFYSEEECRKVALSASLVYVTAKVSGITRELKEEHFIYYLPDGKILQDEKEISRIKALKIPPAYHDVWICPYDNGHIQATGRDNKNRKQYRYHPLWNELRQEQKFHNMIDFGRSLPLIRKHIKKQLNKPFNFGKEQILCAIIYLLDKYYIRIGNKQYARENQSYGITTLRKKHLRVSGNKAVINFKGKNSKTWNIILNNRTIIKILKKCSEIPGYELFKYINDNNEHVEIGSQDLNFYLQSLTSYPFTAKNFRTWVACRETLSRLIKTKKPLKIIIEEVANLLGHTPAICQNNYIYPEIICWKEDNRLEKWVEKEGKNLKSLKVDELLFYWLEHQNKP